MKKKTEEVTKKQPVVLQDESLSGVGWSSGLVRWNPDSEINSLSSSQVLEGIITFLLLTLLGR
jgi:hypothetical protein